MGGQRARVWVSAGLGRRVKSRVARSIARRVATRDTMRLRRPDPSIVPIERARSIVGGVARARVREPKNADGGGFHASGALEVFASRTRASVPVLAVPDAAAPAGRGSFLRGLLLHRGPALVDHRARLDRARGRREKKVSTRSPIARRARGNGDDDAFAFAREPSRFDAPASTGVRLPSAGTFTNAHTERGGTCERLCVWAAPTLVLLCVIGTFHSGLFVAMSSERLVLVFGKFITQADTLIFLRDDLQPRRVIFWRAAEKINASHSRLQTPLARLQTLL